MDEEVFPGVSAGGADGCVGLSGWMLLSIHCGKTHIQKWSYWLENGGFSASPPNLGFWGLGHRSELGWGSFGAGSEMKWILVFMKNACDSLTPSNEKPPAVQSST